MTHYSTYFPQLTDLKEWWTHTSRTTKSCWRCFNKSKKEEKGVTYTWLMSADCAECRESMKYICCINRFTSLCKNLFNLLEFLAEAFRCHMHHFQCLSVDTGTVKHWKWCTWHSEVNLLIQHIIVQDQDGQNNNKIYCIIRFTLLCKIFSYSSF